MKPCTRCGGLFVARHGNASLCSSCKSRRKQARWWQVQAYGERNCPRCRRDFEALAENQVYCSKRCKDASRPWYEKAKYATPEHRRRRARWAPAVASGWVRCARGSSCKHRELVDGIFLGGYIRGPWDLDHADNGNGYLGPSHRECNRATAGRPRAALGESSRIW